MTAPAATTEITTAEAVGTTAGSPGAAPPGARSRLLKPTATIHIANRFSLVERKVLNALIWHAQRQRFGPEEQVVAVEELLELIGFEASKNVATLKDALKRLVGTVIEWNLLGQDRLEEWGVCTFLASARIARGRVRYRLNPEIVERIRNPTLFAKIQLLVQTRFTSRHSLVLYEFLIDWLSRERARGEVGGLVALERLRTLLGFSEEDYGGAYKFFNRDVLKPSIAEIDRLTDIEVRHAPVRSGRKVSALRFSVKRKDAFQLPLDLDGAPPRTGATRNGGARNGDETAEARAATRRIVRALIAAGLGRRAATTLATRHPAARIEANLDYLRARQAAGDVIARPAAWLRRAIEEDFSAGAPDGPSRDAPSRETPSPGAAAPMPGDDEAFQRFRERRCREIFSSMPAAWQETRKHDFVARLRDEARAAAGGSLVWSFYEKSGFASAVVEARFMAELAPELLERPEETDAAAFAAWQARQGATDDVAVVS